MNNDVNVGRTPKIFLGFFILIVLMACFTWFCYNLFNSKDPAIVSSLQVSLTESSKSVSTDDSSIDLVAPHTFNVFNKGSLDVPYKVMISTNNNSMGGESLDLVHYQLILNSKIVKQGSISDISNNILDARTIKGNTTNEYNLKVWLDDDIVDDDIKFSYSLKILPVSED